MPPPKLPKEEVDKLWDYFSRTLRAYGIDPNKYRDMFEEDVSLVERYEEALVLIEDDLRFVVSQEELRRRHFEVVKPAVERFSWREVSRGWRTSRSS